MKNVLLLLSMVFFISCYNWTKIFDNKKVDKFTNLLDEDRKVLNVKLKIIKIKQTSTTYKIYARYKNDPQKILIVSNKNGLICNNKIKVGRVYEFDLKSIIPTKFGKYKFPPPWSRANDVYVFSDGRGGEIEYAYEKGVLFDVFMSSQLEGLCYDVDLKD